MQRSRKVAVGLVVMFATAVAWWLSRRPGVMSDPAPRLSVLPGNHEHTNVARRAATVASAPQPGTPETLYDFVPFRAHTPGTATVTCEIGPNLPGARHPIGPGATRVTFGDKVLPAEMAGGSLVVEVPPGSGTADYALRSETGQFSWEGAEADGAVACTAHVLLTAKIGLYGEMVGAFIRSYASGCGEMVAIEASSFFMEVDAPADCEVKIIADGDGDGMLIGPPLLLHTELGQDITATFSFPTQSDYHHFTDEELRKHAEIAARYNAAKPPQAAPLAPSKAAAEAEPTGPDGDAPEPP